MVARTFARDLEKLMREELILHERYRALLEEERDALRTFKSEKVEALTAQREEIVARLQGLQSQRLTIMEAMHLGDRVEQATTSRRRKVAIPRLSDLVTVHCDEGERSRLVPLIEALRESSDASKNESMKFNQVAGFALTMVNGLLSTIHAASENVVRTYAPNGRSSQSYNPTNSRRQNVIKEA